MSDIFVTTLLVLNTITPNVNIEEQKQITCLTDNGYFEGSVGGSKGMEYPMWTVLNRINNSDKLLSICDVVYEKRRSKKTKKMVAMYSWTVNRPKKVNKKLYNKAKQIATRLYNNQYSMTDPTHGATHFHATWLKPYPLWSKTLKKTVSYKQHIFYR